MQHDIHYPVMKYLEDIYKSRNFVEKIAVNQMRTILTADLTILTIIPPTKQLLSLQECFANSLALLNTFLNIKSKRSELETKTISY